MLNTTGQYVCYRYIYIASSNVNKQSVCLLLTAFLLLLIDSYHLFDYRKWCWYNLFVCKSDIVTIYFFIKNNIVSIYLYTKRDIVVTIYLYIKAI